MFFLYTFLSALKVTYYKRGAVIENLYILKLYFTKCKVFYAINRLYIYKKMQINLEYVIYSIKYINI